MRRPVLRPRGVLARAALLALAATAACSSTPVAPTPASLAGNYSATVFRVTPPGQPQVDALAAGGSITIAIASGGTTTGTLFLPASVTGGSAFTASMAGSITVAGSSVQFVQSADSFIRNLTFTVSGTTLTVTNGVAAGASYTITLTRS